MYKDKKTSQKNIEAKVNNTTKLDMKQVCITNITITTTTTVMVYNEEIQFYNTILLSIGNSTAQACAQVQQCILLQHLSGVT